MCFTGLYGHRWSVYGPETFNGHCTPRKVNRKKRMILLARRRGKEALYQVRSKSDEVSGVYREKQLMAALPWPRKIIIPSYLLLRWRLMPKTHPSPSRIYYTVETALVSILHVVSTHSQLPFEDDASERLIWEEDIVREHPEVSGDIFSIIF